MTLSTDIAEDIETAHFNTDEHAESITYNGTVIDAIVSYGGQPLSADVDAERAVIEVKVSDVPSPAYRDPVIIDGYTWYVFAEDGRVVKRGDGITWLIMLYRTESAVWR